MRTEWRVVINGSEAHVFNREENAKQFIKGVVLQPGVFAAGLDFDKAPLQSGTIELKRTISVIKTTYYEDGDSFELAT